MNWLGLSLRSFLGIVIGAVVGSLIFLWFCPSVLVVGACTGLGCALLAEDRSVFRGISVATAAAWTAAALDAHRSGVSTFQISSVMTGLRLLTHLGSIALAFAAGTLSLRHTKTRVAGT
jgi:hypothetical protein